MDFPRIKSIIFKPIILIIIFSLIAVLLISSCVANVDKAIDKGTANNNNKNSHLLSSDFLVYINADYQIKISYPKDWIPNENLPDIIVAFSATSASDNFQENINLVMNDVSAQSPTLEEFTKSAIENLQMAFQDIEIIESGSAKLSGNNAQKIVYTATSGELSLKVMQISAVKDGISYTWSYVAEENSYNDYISDVQKMIDSFEIIPSDLLEDEKQNNNENENPASEQITSKTLSGNWRVYSERIFYDIGGAGSTTAPVSRNLEIKAEGKLDGSWKFGDPKGKFVISEITDEDWTRWEIDSYGPIKKITLNNWNKATADGPIEISDGRIDFIWVVYHVEPPLVENAGTIWLKFGH